MRAMRMVPVVLASPLCIEYAPPPPSLPLLIGLVGGALRPHFAHTFSLGGPASVCTTVPRPIMCLSSVPSARTSTDSRSEANLNIMTQVVQLSAEPPSKSIAHLEQHECGREKLGFRGNFPLRTQLPRARCAVELDDFFHGTRKQGLHVAVRDGAQTDIEERSGRTRQAKEIHALWNLVRQHHMQDLSSLAVARSTLER
jgi:hypothetical protein